MWSPQTSSPLAYFAPPKGWDPAMNMGKWRKNKHFRTNKESKYKMFGGYKKTKGLKVVKLESLKRKNGKIPTKTKIFSPTPLIEWSLTWVAGLDQTKCWKNSFKIIHISQNMSQPKHTHLTSNYLSPKWIAAWCNRQCKNFFNTLIPNSKFLQENNRSVSFESMLSCFPIMQELLPTYCTWYTLIACRKKISLTI